MQKKTCPDMSLYYPFIIRYIIPISLNLFLVPFNFQRTLEREIRKCQALIIWTDGDREGENIGFEIIEVCKNGMNRLYNLHCF